MKPSDSEFAKLLNCYNLADGNEVEKILGVYYLHLKCDNQDDLYLTKYALPVAQYLLPNNFLTDREWYRENCVSLSGTGCTYKVKTKRIDGHQRDLVVK